MDCSTQNEFRRNAAESIELAQRASSRADKESLLRLAGAWLDLSEKTPQPAAAGLLT